MTPFEDSKFQQREVMALGGLRNSFDNRPDITQAVDEE